MDCPHHGHGALRPVLTRRGVLVDACETCGGIWLDRGELFHFTRDPEPVRRKLAKALGDQRPSDKPSPVAGVPMMEITVPEGIALLFCPKSGGLWLDASAQRALERQDPDLSFDPDANLAAAGPAQTVAPGAIALLGLPNLVMRSTLSLAGLYALLVGALIAAVEFAGADLDLAIGVGVGVVMLQFLLGPFLMDLTLRWLYQTRAVSLADLPAHLGAFVERVSAEQNIKPPRFLMIDDGAPQAFTYGHTPGNARIVISRGILELLEPEEAEAVVAHEIGHAVHWDMLLMTIAQLVPLLLYYLYRSLMRAARSGDKGKDKGGAGMIAVGAYLLYIVSEYLVLWFSRTREYHADRFAGEVTGAPGHLAAALVKIAYGLAGQTREQKADAKKHRQMDAIGALGIFDAGAAQTLAVTSYAQGASKNAGAKATGGAIDKENLTGAMRWDLWNPWAKWYELNSTHPLVANRLNYLSNQARHMGLEPFVTFDQRRPESYWDEFLVDLVVHLLPLIALIGVPATLVALGVSGVPGALDQILAMTLVALGGAMLLRFLFAYRGEAFPEMSVAALLKRVKVSAIRPVPCRLAGTVIGRGVPGYIFSEDFVMRDETGIIFLDFRQPLAIWELLFGLLRAGKFNGKEVEVEGWYRRAPVPYLEIKSITCEGRTRRSWVPLVYQLTALALMAAGLVLAAIPGDVSAWFSANCQVYFLGVTCGS